MRVCVYVFLSLSLSLSLSFSLCSVYELRMLEAQTVYSYSTVYYEYTVCQRSFIISDHCHGVRTLHKVYDVCF
jgi:hypothetical protein